MSFQNAFNVILGELMERTGHGALVGVDGVERMALTAPMDPYERRIPRPA